MDDLYMKKKMTDYIESFAFFRETFIKATGIEDYENIMEQFINFEINMCDCEVCREDDADIHIHVPTDDEDTLPDWD